MGPNIQSTLNLIVLLSTIAVVAFATPPQFEGFQFVGNFTQGNADDSGPSRGVAAKALNLFMSLNWVRQDQAADGCRGIGGKLLSILNVEQNEQVKADLAHFSGVVWTSGVWDSDRDNWFWQSEGVTAHFTNFRGDCHRADFTGYGIVFDLQYYPKQWCAEYKTNKRRYLCAL